METLGKTVEARPEPSAKTRTATTAGRVGQQLSGLAEVGAQQADQLFNLNEAGIRTCFQVNEVILKSTSALNQELMSFADKRLRHEMETGRTLMDNGRDIGKAMKVQQDFSRTMTQDYFACASRLFELAGEMGKGVSVPLGQFYQSTMGMLERRSS